MATVATFPKIICKVKALYAFSSSEKSSLSFEKDDYIDVLSQLDSGWWDGWCNGKRGWFPSNYVQLIDFNPAQHTMDLSDNKYHHKENYDSVSSSTTSTETLNNNRDHRNDGIAPPPRPARRAASIVKQQYHNEEAQAEDIVLPEGWTQQIAEDGITKFYYNQQTGGLRLNHPDYSDSDGEREDSNSNLDDDEYENMKEQQFDHFDDFDFRRKSGEIDKHGQLHSPPSVVDEGSNEHIDLMSFWTKKTTPQGKVYYGNYITHETTWDYNEIDPISGHLKKKHEPVLEVITNNATKDGDVINQEKSDNFSLTSSGSSSILAIEDDAPLTWKSIANEIAQSIHNLNRSVNRGENIYLFRQRVSAVVDSVRLMLYSSRSLDKDASHLQDHEVKEQHRYVLSTLAKLILTAKIITDTNHDMNDRIQRDASELLNSIRRFVLICQAKDIAIEHVGPRLLVSAGADLFEEEPVPRRKSSAHSGHSNTKTRYPLNQDLIVSLQTHAKQIIGSGEALCKAATYIYTLEENQESNQNNDEHHRLDQRARSNVVFLFQNLSSQIGVYLAILGDIDTRHIDSQESQSLAEFFKYKQHLFNSVGLLFSAVQTFTDPHHNLMSSIASIEKVIQKVEASIDDISSSIVQLVGERKLWLMRNDTTLGGEGSVAPGSPVNAYFDLDPKKKHSISEDEHIDPILTRTYQRQGSQGSAPHQRKPSVTNTTSSLTRPDSNSLKRQFSHHSGSQDDYSNLWYLGYDYAEGDLYLTAEKGIKGGTLRALVERLTLHDSIDMSFIANFLLTYRSFCTTEEFVDLLQERYNLAPPEELTPAELVIWADRKQKLIRLRVFNIMKNWLENYYNDEDEFILNKLQLFANTVIYDASSFSADQLTRLIKKRRDMDVPDGGLKKMIPTTMAAPPPILQKCLKPVLLLETDTLEMARQLTLMDFKHYSSIRPVECLGKAWSKEGTDVAPNVKQSIDYCNRLTSWVTGCILSHKDPKKRVIAIKYWAQVANRCIEMNNYNTCLAILSAFDNSAVGRLKKTWDLVSRGTNQILAQIRKIMGSNRNFIEYREMIHSVNPPCIPFLGIYLQDLTFIEDGNPDFLKHSSNLINFAKQQKAAEVIREIKQFQSPPYIFQYVPEIQEFVKYQLSVSRDVDYLYERSLELEPRATE